MTTFSGAALKIGQSYDHWWLHTVLAFYLIIIPAIIFSEYLEPAAGLIKVKSYRKYSN